MASYFKLLVQRVKGSVYLKLFGEFDGFSAYQLISALKQNGAGTSNIFVDTSGIKRVHGFGREVFRSNLHRLNHYFFGDLIFTGVHAQEIAPESSRVL
jgi:hypothetical protein